MKIVMISFVMNSISNHLGNVVFSRLFGGFRCNILSVAGFLKKIVMITYNFKHSRRSKFKNIMNKH